ncbi:unnamed protein product, partial [Meganyctiphanes norvegica]
MVIANPRGQQNIAILKIKPNGAKRLIAARRVSQDIMIGQTVKSTQKRGRGDYPPPPPPSPPLERGQINEVEVEVVGQESLGLMIRGGVEYGLGIFITGVDDNSAAKKAGLQVFDQILEVNGESFLAVTHDAAVNVLKYSRRLRLALRRVNKVPHSCTTYDRRAWPKHQPTIHPRSVENMEATMSMIEEKSLRLLGRNHHAHLRAVVADYAAGRIPIEHFLDIIAQLLNSPDKLGLLTELREVVRKEDLDKFEDTVFSWSLQEKESYLG